MDLSELDKKVILKCFKVKRGVRTYVFNLHKFYDEISECYRLCNLIKRNLGTSMAFESQSEKEKKKGMRELKGKSKVKKSSKNSDGSDKEGEDENEDNNEDENEDNNEDEDEDENEDEEVHKKDKKNKKDKKYKKDKKNKEVVTKALIEDPIFSFGGNQINKIKKYLVDNEIVLESEIKL